MSSTLKIVIGALLSALLAWLFAGPLGLASKCVSKAAPEAAKPVASAPIAKPKEVVDCQSGVDAAVNGKTIQFESGHSTIRAESLPIIDALAKAAKDCKGVAIAVDGHTDQQGDADFNMKLSQSRADAVVNALSERGVAKDAMTGKGYGETQLKDQAETPEALAKNRRIEFKVSSGAAKAADAAPAN